MHIKRLVKKMTEDEISEYISSHKKYRLLTSLELNEHTTNTDVVVCSDSIDVDEKQCVVFDGSTCTVYTVSSLFKTPVILTYTNEYLEFVDECNRHIAQADPMAIGNILLRRMIEDYL